MIKDCQVREAIPSIGARSRAAQEHHFFLCMTTYIVLERESKEKRITIYKLKRRLSSQDIPLPLLPLEGVAGGTL